MSGWSRGDVIGCSSLIVTTILAIVAIIVGVANPEVRCKVGLDKSCRSPISKPHDQELTQNGGEPKSPPTPDPDTNLISKSTEVDYNPLRNLLAEGKWKDADRETARTMVKAAGREEEGGLSDYHINSLPCEDLSIIDKLWLNYSDGKFGFSVQNKIYENEGGSYSDSMDYLHRDMGSFNFADRVGWEVENSFFWIEYEEHLFNLQAPKGHLPSACGIYGGWVDGRCGGGQVLMFVRLSYRFAKTCNLQQDL